MGDTLFNKLFSEAGLSITSELSNNRFLYSCENMLKDFKNNLGLESDLFKTIFDQYEISYESPFKMEANLLPFTYNETYIDSTRTYNTHIADCRDFTSSLLYNKKVAKENGNIVYKYLMNGYDALTAEEKVIVNAVDFGTSILDVPSYNGMRPLENVYKAAEYIVYHDFDGYNPTTFLPGEYEISTYNEEDLTYYLRTSKAIYDFDALSTENGIISLTIADVYAQIVDSHIYFIYVIDLNGCETSLVLDYEQAEPSLSADYKATFDLKDVYYGSKKASDSLKAEILKEFKKTIDTAMHLGWMSYNEESNALSLDFKPFIKDTTYGDYYINYGVGKVKTTPSSLTQLGGLVLSFVKS